MNIEDYIKNNKDQIDIHQPDEERMWQEITNRNTLAKQNKLRIFRWIAACALVTITIGALLRHEIIINKQLTGLSAYNTEMAQKEHAYILQVNQKWEHYGNMTGNASVMEPWLLEELSRLDTIYLNGIEDLKHNGYNERAMYILLDTYEKRLRIIEQLIKEKQKQRKYENRDKKINI